MRTLIISLLFLALVKNIGAQTCSVSASKNPVCIGDTILLTASSSFTNGSYFFSGPNGVAAANDSVKIIVNTTAYAGIYQCSVSSGTSSCLASLNLTVNPSPVINIISNANTGCVPLCVSFTCVSSPAPQAVSWQFGNSFTGSGTIANSCYTIASTYSVKASVVDVQGCKASVINTIQVNPKPTAQISTNTTSACAGTSVTLNGNGGSSYFWDLGGIGTSTTQNSTFVALYNGNYNCSLIVTNSFGCKDTDHVTLTVFPKPIADFNYASGLGGNFQLIDASYNAAIGSWKWYVDGTLVSTLQNPFYTFPDTTINYNVCLVVKALGSCSDSICKTIFFNPFIGILENNSNDASKIYPNPVSEKIIIEMKGNGVADIYDALGDLVKRSALTSGRNEIDVVDLESGIYYVIIKTNDHYLLPKKLIKS